jgi:hemerythrin
MPSKKPSKKNRNKSLKSLSAKLFSQLDVHFTEEQARKLYRESAYVRKMLEIVRGRWRKD